MLRGLIVIIAALSFAGPGLAKPKTEPAVERGHDVARQRCAACHAVEPGADSPMRDAPSFAGRDMQHTTGLEGRLAFLTREGHYDMPPMTLTDSELRDLIAYIGSLAPH